MQVDITVGPDITASNWNTSATGTDLNFDAAWPLSEGRSRVPPAALEAPAAAGLADVAGAGNRIREPEPALAPRLLLVIRGRAVSFIAVAPVPAATVGVYLVHKPDPEPP